MTETSTATHTSLERSQIREREGKADDLIDEMTSIVYPWGETVKQASYSEDLLPSGHSTVSHCTDLWLSSQMDLCGIWGTLPPAIRAPIQCF